MNKELIKKRKEELTANLAKEHSMREQITTALKQNEANIQALGGAMQDLEYWEQQLIEVKAESMKETKKVEKLEKVK